MDPRQPSATAFRSRGRWLRSWPFWFWLPACTIWLPVLALAANKAPSEKKATTVRRDTKSVQNLVDDLRDRLSLPQAVKVSIVSKNALMVSVESLKGRDRAFRMSFEARFLEALSDEELEAVVAHELGHVWIFTHHPYLQTEQLANRIAMRLVSRDSLVRVYEKVWARGGAKGDLTRFLGNEDLRRPQDGSIPLHVEPDSPSVAGNVGQRRF